MSEKHAQNLENVLTKQEERRTSHKLATNNCIGSVRGRAESQMVRGDKNAKYAQSYSQLKA